MTSHPVRIPWTLDGCRAAAVPEVCPDLLPPVILLPTGLLVSDCHAQTRPGKHAFF